MQIILALILFYHQLNPAFGPLIKKERVRTRGYALLREGAFYLLDFFKKFDRPSEELQYILVHRNFEWLIPNEWKSNYLTFDVNYRGRS